jgi:hypothetical protein
MTNEMLQNGNMTGFLKCGKRIGQSKSHGQHQAGKFERSGPRKALSTVSAVARLGDVLG